MGTTDKDFGVYSHGKTVTIKICTWSTDALTINIVTGSEYLEINMSDEYNEDYNIWM